MLPFPATHAPRRQAVCAALLLGAALLGLPLTGAWLAGLPVGEYLEFPPLTRYVVHAPFAWPVFVGLAVVIVAVVFPFVRQLWRGTAGGTPAPAKAGAAGVRSAHCESGVEPPHSKERLVALIKPSESLLSVTPPWSTAAVAGGAPGHVPPGGGTYKGRFPVWGWAAVAMLAVAWVLAWTRFAWFAPLQRYTFVPLWLSAIGVLSALTQRRAGTCLMTRRPGFFAALFAASTLFWWFFEYLNRFCQNWYYRGAEGMTATQYALVASASFATVLPAVLAAAEWLGTFPRLQQAFLFGRAATGQDAQRPAVGDNRPPGVVAMTDGVARRTAAKDGRPGDGCPADSRPPAAAATVAEAHRGRSFTPAASAWATLALGGAGLAGLGVYPDLLFPLLWLAPLAMSVAAQALLGRPTVFDGVRRGDWRVPATFALAGLLCGGLWEMWNFWSLARWEYSVPFVQRFLVFEMPLLGYAGYLPFGCECAAAALWLAALWPNTEHGMRTGDGT